MRPLQIARLYALKSVWNATGLRSAGRALVAALGSPDEDVRIGIVDAVEFVVVDLEETYHRAAKRA